MSDRVVLSHDILRELPGKINFVLEKIAQKLGLTYIFTSDRYFLCLGMKGKIRLCVVNLSVPDPIIIHLRLRIS